MQKTSLTALALLAALYGLAFPASGAQAANAANAANTVDMTSIPGLAHTVMPGDIIGEQDIIWISIPQSRVTQTMITDREGLIGLAARRPLGANDPVRFSDVERPVVIKRGALVAMTIKTPAMTLSATGRAQENGSVGERIRLVNTSSNRTIQGVVISAREVKIISGSRIASAY